MTGWRYVPLKHLVNVNLRTLSETTPPDLPIDYIDIGSVDATRGIIRTEPLLFGQAPSRARRMVSAGDVIVSTVRTYLGAVAAVGASHDGAVSSTGFAVLTARPSQMVPSFLAYAVSLPSFVQEVVARSTGVSYPAIGASELVRIRVPAPAKEDQLRIADFLDRESQRIHTVSGRIDALLGTQERWLESVLFERLVRSEGPVIQVGRLMTLQRGHDLPDAARRPGNVPVLGSGGQVGFHDEARLLAPAIITGRYGSVGNVQWLDRACWPLNTTLYVRDTRGNDPRYLYHLLRALPLRSEATKSAVPGLHRADVHRMDVRELSLEGQRAAVDHIDAVEVELRRTMERSVRMKDLLREYRDALITEVVTGQLDVTRVSDLQMDERAHAAMEGEPLEAVR